MTHQQGVFVPLMALFQVAFIIMGCSIISFWWSIIFVFVICFIVYPSA